MKYQVLAACILLIACVAIAGCTQGTTTTQTTSPAGTQAASATAAATPHATFAPFQNEKDIRTEEFRVDNPAWGIDFVVLPLNDDPQYCWFEMTVTNMDNGQKDTYGFGRTYGFEKHQQFPMYVTGPYKVEMKGNLVKVDVTAAKRNP